MASPQALVGAFASTQIRLFSFVFLRWIPGHHFPPIIFTAAAVYLVCFVICAIKDTRYEILADEVDVRVRHVNGSVGSTSSRSGGPSNVEKASAEASRNNNDSAIDDTSEDEVDMDVTFSQREKDPQVFRTLLTGLPSPSSFALSAVSFVSNAILVIMVFDLVFRGAWYYAADDLSFARVGHVSHDSARIFIREPNVTQYPLHLSYRYIDHPVSRASGHRPFDAAWKTAKGISELTEATDYTATFLIDGLKPESRYQYAFSNAKNGYFVTGRRSGSFSGASGNEDKFTFMHSSCIIPHFPYNPLDHPLHIPGLRHLAPWLSKIRPQFMLFLGDFIYIDVPHRHGSSREDYRRAYRQVYASPNWPSVSRVEGLDISQSGGHGRDKPYDLPWIHVYDDHEIANDWNANTTGVFPAAFDPYLHYHLGPNPPIPHSTLASRHSHASNSHPPLTNPQPLTPDTLAHNTSPTYTTFTSGPATFFLTDTRRYRTSPNLLNPLDPHRSILGPTQLSALKTWLTTPPPPGVNWKFLITSVPFTKNWRTNAQDTWSGYLFERRELLEVIWRAQASSDVGIVILSGDRHEFAATAISPPESWVSHENELTERERSSKQRRRDGGGGAMISKESATVIEFSNSPLSQFYLPIQTYREDAEASIQRPLGPPTSWMSRLWAHLTSPAGTSISSSSASAAGAAPAPAPPPSIAGLAEVVDLKARQMQQIVEDAATAGAATTEGEKEAHPSSHTSTPPPAEDIEQDHALAYIPAGNSKFGIVDIESVGATGGSPHGKGEWGQSSGGQSTGGQSILKYRAVVDGVVVWSHVLLSGDGSGGSGGREGERGSVLREAVWG